MPWEEQQWSDQDWQDSSWWSSHRHYRGSRGGNPWRQSQVRRNWGDFGGSWSSGANQGPQQSIPQLPPPPANQEGRWEVSYKWIPAEATPAAAGPNTPPEPIVPAEPAEPAAPAEPRAVEEKEEEEWKEEWTGTKEEQPWEEDEDQSWESWGNWQPELAKPVDVPKRDTSNRSRTPPSRTTSHRRVPLLRRAGDRPLILPQREPEPPRSPERRKQPRSEIWYGYYDRPARDDPEGEEQRSKRKPTEPKEPPPPWKRGDVARPEGASVRSVSATPKEDRSRPTYPELRDLYKGSQGEGVLIGSETEAERSTEEIYEPTEGPYSPGDKRISLKQQTSAGDLRPRPTQKALFSPSLSQQDFAERFRGQQLAIRRREESEAKRQEEEEARLHRTRLRGAYNQGSKPTLGLDWHRTVAGDNGVVSAANRSLLYELLESGYRLCIISFASSRKRQEQVLSGRRALQHVLGFPLRLVLCPRKLTTDRESRPSITGDTISKAEAIEEEKISVYIDDQAQILQDVERNQRHRPRGSRTLCLQASRDPEFTLAPLRKLLQEKGPEELPVLR